MQVRGETVAILASGPSMSRDVADAVNRMCVATIVINNTWRLAPWADALFAADAPWWRSPKAPTAEEFAGERFVSEEPTRHGMGPLPGVTHIPKRDVTFGGGNSALRAAHMCQDLGAREILLYGVDLRDDEVTHWHGPHTTLRNPDLLEFGRQRRAWEVFAKTAGRPEVRNCNPRSAVTCFPFHA